MRSIRLMGCDEVEDSWCSYHNHCFSDPDFYLGFLGEPRGICFRDSYMGFVVRQAGTAELHSLLEHLI